MTLSSKEFTIVFDDDKDYSRMLDRISKLQMGKGYVLKPGCRAAGHRIISITVKEEIDAYMYKDILAKAPVKIFISEEFRAVFRFDDDQFLYKDRSIYLTPDEKLFLLLVLCLKRPLLPNETTERALVSRMRGKFGKDFLKGLV